MADMSLGDGVRQLEARARLAIAWIWAFMGIAIAESLAEIAEGAGIVDIESAGLGLELYLLLAAYFGYTLIFVGSVIFISRWIYRAHANLRAANIDRLQFTPGWAVGWYFIPIANLFKPFGAMRELWNASFDPESNFGADSPGSVKLWWGCFVIGNILSNVAFRISMQEDPDLATSAIFGTSSNVMLVICAFVLAQIIRDITAAQRDRLVAATFA
jgi:hypothetical protein